MLNEVERCKDLGIKHLVIHPGSHKGAGEKTGLNKVAKALNRIIRETKGGHVKIILETVAGQGSNLGYKFEQLAYLLDKVKVKKRVGVCFDTSHVFAAGYDIRTRGKYSRTMKEFDSLIGLKNLLVFHMNDSKAGLGSKVDRHEHIGKGKIGLTGFKNIVIDRRFKNIPMILETPGFGKSDGNKRNLKVLRRLCKEG